MNYSMVMYIIGWILNFEAAFMLPSCLVAVIYQEKCGISFLITMAAALVIGIPLTVRKPKNKDFHSREGFASVALGWIVLSIVGAVPFVISGVIPNPVEALFEAVSGFTTTGSSVLTNVEVVPRCILFWRSFTHWIGGMGVLVFIMAILPLSGGKNINLMRAESPGPSVTKMTSKIKSTAKVLYQIYIVMTIIQIILLLIGKMPLFDALTITFGTAGTGGFGIKNDSLAGYSPYLQYVVTTFMILFGVNFNFYFLLLLKKPIEALKSEEVRWYFGIIAAAVLVIFLYIRSSYPTAEEAFRHSAFQVGSIITTTGYATTDFNLWAQVPRTILVMLMFVGACAGSTGGGIKVSRILILGKTIRKELNQLVHPTGVKKLQMDGRLISHEVLRAANVYMIIYILIFAFSVLLVGIDDFDLVTNFTAVATTLNNVGPGLEMVGPTGNFSAFSNGTTLVMIFDMLAGRLELFPLLLLFHPGAWKKF
ncbi:MULTISPECIES: TrkH family potassium uptake protein [Clostridia]|uniref:Potassium transporter KefA n=1 Tax=Sellimonas catena TaxID=2994035 RepID=A0A9W6CE85_9FIRM|nr:MULTISPECIES: TrkH family potassium uptake protein [Clostridia]OUN67750.1 potassium transporter KefA [Drancourtella sp. An57]GLG90999.1 potassium transporter KefA [Sellimonas catena]